MRTSLLLALALMLPSPVSAQVAPRSVAVETGWTGGSSPDFPDRVPVALGATWWLAGDLDLAARVAWASAARPDDRAADAVLEAGLGLRQGVARWSAVRWQVLLDVAAVRSFRSGAFTAATGGRISAGGAIEAFVARDLSFSVVVEEGVLLGAGGGTCLGGAVRAAAYF